MSDPTEKRESVLPHHLPRRLRVLICKKMDTLGFNPDELEVLAPPWGQLGRAFTLGVVAGISKLLLSVCNTLKVHNHDTFLDAVLKRDPEQGLLTIANHTRFATGSVVWWPWCPWSVCSAALRLCSPEVYHDVCVVVLGGGVYSNTSRPLAPLVHLCFSSIHPFIHLLQRRHGGANPTVLQLEKLPPSRPALGPETPPTQSLMRMQYVRRPRHHQRNHTTLFLLD